MLLFFLLLNIALTKKNSQCTFHCSRAISLTMNEFIFHAHNLKKKSWPNVVSSGNEFLLLCTFEEVLCALLRKETVLVVRMTGCPRLKYLTVSILFIQCLYIFLFSSQYDSAFSLLLLI